ncbi:MAG: response regulator [Rhodospirillales bacterium]|nr:response regulator [Rhodospirillales bacterium]MCB9997139.1 response regulator [Rhodospirillales bacterium]
MRSCLIVDDSVVIRKLVRTIIEDFDFECHDAEHGEAALNFCKTNPLPTLVMLDWNMPVMNGLDFLKSLRTLDNGSAPVVIFCTTENDMTHIQMALEAGANDFIMKPFDKEIVRGKLEQNHLWEPR